MSVETGKVAIFIIKDDRDQEKFRPIIATLTSDVIIFKTLVGDIHEDDEAA